MANTEMEKKSMRKEFHMTDAQLDTVVKASQPTMAIALHTGPPPDPQAIANAAWADLGRELGFDFMTARPVAGKSQHFFTAETTVESEAAKCQKKLQS